MNSSPLFLSSSGGCGEGVLGRQLARLGGDTDGEIGLLGLGNGFKRLTLGALVGPGPRAITSCAIARAMN